MINLNILNYNILCNAIIDPRNHLNVGVRSLELFQEQALYGDMCTGDTKEFIQKVQQNKKVEEDLRN